MIVGTVLLYAYSNCRAGHVSFFLRHRVIKDCGLQRFQNAGRTFPPSGLNTSKADPILCWGEIDPAQTQPPTYCTRAWGIYFRETEMTTFSTPDIFPDDVVTRKKDECPVSA